MGIEVLGPAAIDGVDGLALRDRVVLQALVVRADEVVDKEVLADALWGDGVPATWPKVVQGCIARLRKQLPPGAITTTPHGYRLSVHEDQLDSRKFERMVGRAREHLVDHDPDRASYVLAEALSLWRGRALSDVYEWEPGRAEAERLEGLRMDAQELRVEAEIAAGRSRTVLENARLLVKEAPFRERRWAVFAQALYQSGRQTEALDVLGRARRMLREELGLDAGPELLALEESILRQDPALTGSEAVTASRVCPYRGLLPYEAGDAEAFFGRDADIAACLEKLRAQGALAVVGPSGSGKSSLVRAGVAAALERDGTRVLVTTPGARPLDALADLPTRRPSPVLVVDQAEEAVSLCTDPAERASYFARLDEYDGPLVIALRADRLGDVATYPEFARLVERGLYLLTAMSEDNLRAAIEGPARHAGLRLEAGLVDLLVREVEGEPGALPMLSHVLRKTWELREGPTLTVEGYRATGGIRNAVAQSAEHLYEGLDEVQRAQLRALFLRLVMPSEAGEPVRARVPRSKVALDRAHEQLIDSLVDARLVSSDEGDVQIAHEALAREWPRLRGWLQEDIEGQRIFRHLAGSAEAWDALGRPDSELYRGIRLAGALDWADKRGGELTETEREFVAGSRAHAQRERQDAQEQLAAQARSNNRLRVLLGRLRLALVGAGVLLAAALVAGLLALDAADRARDQTRAAADSARIADSRRLAAQALTTTEPDLALLLGVEAARLDDSIGTESSLFALLQKTSRLVGVARGTGTMASVDLSTDGTTVAVGTFGGASGGGLLTYDAATLERIEDRDDLPVMGLEYSPDGRHLVVAGSALDDSARTTAVANPLQILDATSLEPVATFGGFPKGDHVEDAIDFSGDGKRLAAVAWSPTSDDKVVLVWDFDHPEKPILRKPSFGLGGTVELSPDGEVLYVGMLSPEFLRAIDVDTGEVLWDVDPDYGGERNPVVAVNEDGSMVAASDVDGIAVRSGGDLRLRFKLAGQSQGVTALAFSRDGSRLAAGYTDGTTIVWDLAGRKPLDTLRGHSLDVTALTLSGDGGTLYSVGADHQLLAFDLTGGRGFPPWRRYRDNPQGEALFAAIPSPDGKKVFYQSYGDSAVGYQGQVQFRDVETGRMTRLRLLPKGAPAASGWSPDSRFVLAAAGYTGYPARPGAGRPVRVLQVWDPESGTVTRTRRDTDVLYATFSADGTRLMSVSLSGPQTIRTLDPKTLEPTGQPAHLDRASCCFPSDLSPDGSTFVGFYEGSTVGVVADLRTGAVDRVDLDAVPTAFEYSPDGTRVAVVRTDSWGVLSAESLRRGEAKWMVRPQEFKAGEAWTLTWTRDGTQIITTGNGVVDLWDAETLEHFGNLDAPKDLYAWVQPLADGHTVVIAHPKGDVLTWDLRPQHLLDVACALAGRSLSRDEWVDLVGTRPYRRTCPPGG